MWAGSVAWLPWHPDSTRGCHVDLSILSVDSAQQNAPDVTDVKTDQRRNLKFMLKEVSRGDRRSKTMKNPEIGKSHYKQNKTKKAAGGEFSRIL